MTLDVSYTAKADYSPDPAANMSLPPQWIIKGTVGVNSFFRFSAILWRVFMHCQCIEDQFKLNWAGSAPSRFTAGVSTNAAFLSLTLAISKLCQLIIYDVDYAAPKSLWLSQFRSEGRSHESSAFDTSLSELLSRTTCSCRTIHRRVLTWATSYTTARTWPDSWTQSPKPTLFCWRQRAVCVPNVCVVGSGGTPTVYKRWR